VSGRLVTLLRHAAVALGISVGAAVLALAWPAAAEARWTALAGVAACSVSGFVSLAFKSQARSVNEGLLAVVLVFGVRAAVALLGATWAIQFGGGAMPFVIGFFGTYFPLQWVEIRYLLVAVKQDRVES
jgi:hypothetical protein